MWPWQKGPEMTRRDTPEMDIMGPGGTRRDITGGPGEVLLGSQEGCGYGTRMDTVMGPGGIMGPEWTRLWDQEGHGYGTRSMLSHGTRRDIIRRL